MLITEVVLTEMTQEPRCDRIASAPRGGAGSSDSHIFNLLPEQFVSVIPVGLRGAEVKQEANCPPTQLGPQ